MREIIQTIHNKSDKSSGKRRQEVHIKCDLIAYIPPDELMKKFQA